MASLTAGLLMLAFDGRQAPPGLLDRLATDPPAGFTLFRHLNVESAEQLRALTGALQSATPAADLPLLLAADQEGGQLNAMGDFTTQFAGAMALGAAGDVALAERVGRAIGRELRAVGINVNYSPVCDLASQPANPGLGIRSFGDDAESVAALAAATVRGLQAEGVAATAKHFPGKGDAAADTHHELAVVERSAQGLRERELVPFRAAIEAGVKLVMSGHFALPALSGDATLPNTLSRAVMHDLLRDELGFAGLAITDALDMRALAQGPGQIVDVVSALRAGDDLLLGAGDESVQRDVETGVAQAVKRRLVDPAEVAASRARLDALRGWLRGFAQPPLDVVGCAAHQSLARELAQRSITVVRDAAGLLPLRLAADAKVVVVLPQTANLTPADTSSFVTPDLAGALRRRYRAVEQIVTAVSPTEPEVAALLPRLSAADLVILGTISAALNAAQAAMARRVLELGRPTVTVALRTPWDLTVYPAAATYLCSYGILLPTLEALAAVLFGEIDPVGRLPVALPAVLQPVA